MIKVFLDASVIIAALLSPKGGSAKICQSAREKKILAISSKTVVNEVLANLHKMKKLDQKDVENFILQKGIIVRQKVTRTEIIPFRGIVEEKDAHVLAGAILTKCDYLVTLDKKHFLKEEVKKKVKNIKLIAPKEFLISNFYRINLISRQ